MSKHFVYLLQHGDIYKIYITTKNFDECAKEHDEETELLLSCMVDDGIAVERIVTEKFDELFVRRADLGSGYYSGDATLMMKIIMLIILDDNIKNASTT